MQYVKYIDENTIEPVMHVLMVDGTVIVNPRLQTLIDHGYKPLVEAERAEQTGNGYWREWYEETETNVIKHYEFVEVVEVPEEPNEDPTEEPIEEPSEDPTDDPIPADGVDGSPASSESEDAPTEEGGE